MTLKILVVFTGMLIWVEGPQFLRAAKSSSFCFLLHVIASWNRMDLKGLLAIDFKM